MREKELMICNQCGVVFEPKEFVKDEPIIGRNAYKCPVCKELTNEPDIEIFLLDK